jgi:hypothetical protein
MSAESFFNRWSRKKRESYGQEQEQAVQAEAAPAAPAALAPESGMPAPTLDDVEQLTPDSDFSRFMKRDVDETVKRGAMKKLFTDPHFNVMDGLDIYIDDYNKFEPLPAAMVALLEHAKPILNPLANLAQPAMAMVEGEQAQSQAALPAADVDAQALADATDAEAQEPAQQEAVAAMQQKQPASGQQEQTDPAEPDNTAEAANQSPATPEDGHPIQSL